MSKWQHTTSIIAANADAKRLFDRPVQYMVHTANDAGAPQAKGAFDRICAKLRIHHRL